MSKDDAQDQEVQLSPPDDGGWHHTVMRDWIAVCPEIGPTAFRLYAITRSLLIEKRGAVRKLTLLELCKLLPGPNGKPSSLGRIRDAVRELSAVGLYTTPDGQPITTSSSAKAADKALAIRINDYPAKGWAYEGPRNAFAALDAVRGEAVSEDGEGASEAGWISNQGEGAGWKSNQVGQKSNQSGWKSNSDVPLTSGNAAPKEDLEVRPGSKTVVVTAVGQPPVVGAGPGGGFAASGKTAPDPKAAPRDLRTVMAGIPGQLAALLEVDFADGLPSEVNGWISHSLLAEQRTAQQLVDRLARRWMAFGYDNDSMTVDGRGIGSAYGVLKELLSPSKCWRGDARCEDGVDIDKGTPCARCADAKAEKAASVRPAMQESASSEGEPESTTYTAAPYVPAQPREPITETSAEAQATARAAVQAGKTRIRHTTQ